MFEVIFLLCLALVWIIFASLQDLRQREVANWLNFSLIAFALGFRFFYSLFEFGEYWFFYQGLIGLGIFFVLGNLFYYARLFAGGDAKLLIALGAVLPFSREFFSNVGIFVIFLLLFLVVGAVYGLAWSVFLTFRNYAGFKKEFKKRFAGRKKLIHSSTILGILFVLLGFFETLFFVTGVLIFVFPYFYLYAKSVEEACMIRKVSWKNLTVGDWLYQDLKVGGKTIKANWEGLDEKDIALLKKVKKDVLIKQGIPFVPVFLISFLFLAYFYLWNPFWQYYRFF